MVHFGSAAKEVNVKIAFLNGEPKEEVYMQCPPGMNHLDKDFTKNMSIALFKQHSV